MGAILDRQHTGKSPASTDLGAWHDLDGDGRRELWEQEALLTPRYLWHAEIALRKQGRPVIPLSDGSYVARHARAVSYAQQAPTRRWAYVAAHLNAGGGDYGSVFFDHLSSGGKLLAESIAASLEEHCPELARVRVIAAPGEHWANAHATIAGIFAGPSNLSGVCYEPCFVDQPAHRALLTGEGLRRVGLALAEGVTGWAG